MKIKVNRVELAKALGDVLPAIPQKATLPILNHVLLVVENIGNEIILSGTDLKTRVDTCVKCESEVDGCSIALNAKKLDAVVNSFSGEIVNITVKDLDVKVECAKSTFKFKALDGAEFPLKAEFEGTGFDVDYNTFKSFVGKTSFAASTDEMRPILNGVLWELGEDDRGYENIQANMDSEGTFMQMTATDGHRLSSAKSGLFDSVDFSSVGKALIDPKALKMAAKFFDTDFYVKVSANFVSFASGNRTLHTRLIDGEYVDWEQVVPANEIEVILNRVGLIQALKRSSIVADNGLVNHSIYSFAEGVLSISVDDPLSGSQSLEEINFDGDAVTFEASYDNSYLISILQSFEGDVVTVKINDDPTRALTVHGENTNQIGLVMPVRIKN